MSIETATELLKKNITHDMSKLHIISAMQSNRKERRAIAKANGIEKIAAANRPFVKIQK